MHAHTYSEQSVSSRIHLESVTSRVLAVIKKGIQGEGMSQYH